MTSTRTAGSGRRPRWSIESVAGWVFADLFLVLFLVGLGSAVTVKPTAGPTTTPTVAPTSKPTPKPTPAPIVGLKPVPTPLNITIDADALTSGGQSATAAGAVVCARVRQEAARLTGQRAGLVLIFGGGPDVGSGQAVARGVAKQLTCANPALFARSTPSRPFWDGTLDYGRVRLEVFVFTTKKTT